MIVAHSVFAGRGRQPAACTRGTLVQNKPVPASFVLPQFFPVHSLSPSVCLVLSSRPIAALIPRPSAVPAPLDRFFGPVAFAGFEFPVCLVAAFVKATLYVIPKSDTVPFPPGLKGPKAPAAPGPVAYYAVAVLAARRFA